MSDDPNDVMNRLLRGVPDDEPDGDRVPDFDQGVRTPPPGPGPSPNQQLRRALGAKRGWVGLYDTDFPIDTPDPAA